MPPTKILLLIGVLIVPLLEWAQMPVPCLLRAEKESGASSVAACIEWLSNTEFGATLCSTNCASIHPPESAFVRGPVRRYTRRAAAQRLQHITTLFRKIRRCFHEPALASFTTGNSIYPRSSIQHQTVRDPYHARRRRLDSTARLRTTSPTVGSARP